jgi:hypothetical protein
MVCSNTRDDYFSLCDDFAASLKLKLHIVEIVGKVLACIWFLNFGYNGSPINK